MNQPLDSAVLDAKLAAFLVAQRLPGATAGVVLGDQLAWSGSAGFADRATRQPATARTLYRIASITKTMTGTAVMRLRDAGSLGLDDPVVAYLPELRRAVSPFTPIEAISLRQLLSHESGLPVEPPDTDWWESRYQGDPKVTLANAADLAFLVPPFAQHKYSDLAYQLLGEVVSRVSGTPYPRYLRTFVLDPLGMSATAFDPLPPALAKSSATGYGWRALSDELPPAPPLPAVWAEGGLWSAVADLGRWISFQLSAYRPASSSDATAVVRGRTLREMHQPRYLADDTWTTAWGISWCGVRRDDVTWIQHSGGVPGFSSTVCFEPAQQVGAIVLINGTTGNSTELAFDLAATVRDLAGDPPPVITVPEPVPEEYRPFLGIYSRPDQGGWLLRLEWRDGKLAFTAPEAPGFELELVPTGAADVFTIRPGTNFAGEHVTFRRDSDGAVVSVNLVETSYVRLRQAVL